MDRRGGRRSSAAFFLAAFLSLVPLPRALAGEIPPPAPRFESAECPFEIPSDGSVRYGRLVVPENRQKPGSGRTVSIAVLILKSRSDHPRPDPVLYLEGGPGGPSVAYYEDWLASPILDHRDLVLFDQRGVGNSLPSLDCPEIRTARMAASSPGLDGKAASRLLVDAAGTCAARIRESGIDLSAYNTAESARDLADLRKAWGCASGTFTAFPTAPAWPCAFSRRTLKGSVPLSWILSWTRRRTSSGRLRPMPGRPSGDFSRPCRRTPKRVKPSRGSGKPSWKPPRGSTGRRARPASGRRGAKP